MNQVHSIEKIYLRDHLKLRHFVTNSKNELYEDKDGSIYISADKQGIYKVLRTETDIQGNDLEVLDFCNNILDLEKALNISGLQIPKTSIKPLPSKSKSIIKPLFSSGGLNISFYKKDKNNFLKIHK